MIFPCLPLQDSPIPIALTVSAGAIQSSSPEFEIVLGNVEGGVVHHVTCEHSWYSKNGILVEPITYAWLAYSSFSSPNFELIGTG